ncbi:unnamed protein product [Lampetra fluviatilis]
MSIAVPDRHASSEGTVVSESCPMESPVNPEPSSSSNRKKNKKAKSCQSGNNQGGVIAQNTAGTRSKKHGKKKKRRDLQEGLPRIKVRFGRFSKAEVEQLHMNETAASTIASTVSGEKANLDDEVRRQLHLNGEKTCVPVPEAVTPSARE